MAIQRHDEVDTIVQAWERERPDLDATPLQVLSRISRLARRLEQARADTFTAHDLDGWEFDVLAALRRTAAPHELSPGALIQETLVTSGTMTNRVDRLEQRGFVERRRDTADRRGVLVRLTATGGRVVDAAFADLLAREQLLLNALPARERDRLASSLRRLLSAVEEP
ncbi:MarR family winged helix-turn-helix transcriptional regulator [Demetria terragena]|uniref:MarR family winged helix-turn-helix transcriptional regulator n=1 Tax=Demetria terragena TaxID=63959 RepID=UPI00035DCB7A|nr:MarR family transcriptional regulator [Demetria terragena]